MNNKYLFLHIPKTAGSSLYALFANILGPENVKQVPNTNNLGLRQIDMLRMNAGDGQLVVFDGERSQINPPLLPLGEGRYRIRIIAPDSAGEYILRLTLVQEGLAWFDSLPQQVYEDVSFKVGAEYS